MEWEQQGTEIADKKTHKRSGDGCEENIFMIGG